MKIEYYKKIRRLLSTYTYNSSRMIFWKERLKKALKIQNTISWLQYDYIAITKETLSTLDFFIDSIYLPSITSKNNANPSSIKTSILKWINEDKSYSFLWLHINNILIWGKILSYKDKTLNSWRSSFLPEYHYINQYAEYLFVEYALWLWVEHIWVGVSPNLCGYMPWSWPSVALHKLELHMSPYVTKIEEKEIIDTDTINKESILFLSHDRIQYTQSIVFLPKDNVQQLKEKYSLLEKRGLDIKYNYF